MGLTKVARDSDGWNIRMAKGISVTAPLHPAATGAEVSVAGFRLTAKASGCRLNTQKGFDALILMKQTWRISPYAWPCCEVLSFS